MADQPAPSWRPGEVVCKGARVGGGTHEDELEAWATPAVQQAAQQE